MGVLNKMKINKLKGKCRAQFGVAITNWGKLIENPRLEREGKKLVFIGLLQTRYAITYSEVEKMIKACSHKYK